MHDPYELYPILKPINQIDCIAAYDDKFLFSTKQGDLIMYSVVYKDDIGRPEVQLLRYHKNFYRKPIQQLAVIPCYSILCILTDNTVFIHDLSSTNFPLISTLQKTKGAHLFAVDVWDQAENSLTRNTTYMVRLCVAVKRRLQLFYWKNHEFLKLGEDITVSDIPKSIALCQQSVCVGIKNEYILIKLNDAENKRELEDLFPSGKNVEPCITKINDSFALVRDNCTAIVDTGGKVLPTAGVKWSELPTAIAYDEPYQIALLNETIEVRSMQPSLLIQQIQIAGAQLICRDRAGVLYVLAGRQVFRVQSIPAEKQITMLLEEKQFQLAVKLCNILECPEDEKIKRRRDIQTLYAYDLFHNKQYEESMKQFLNSFADPYDVVRLYPNLLPQYPGDDEMQPPGQQNRDSDKSVQALIDYLTEVRWRANKKENNPVEQEQILKIVDTTLLKCYINTNDTLIAPLLRLNCCHVEESEMVLKRHKKYNELIILYQMKGLHQKALELLERQADQSDSPLKGVKKTIEYMHYLLGLGPEYIDLILRYSGWVLEKDPENGLKIFTEDLPEVEQLPRQRILEYLLKTKKSLVLPYLEHLIYWWNDKTPQIHNALVHQYREKVLQLRDSSSLPTEQVAGNNMRAKLMSFLKKSEYYTAETVLSQFPFDDLLEERAVLLGKLKQHNRALAIYVMVLRDTYKAVEYCDQVYKRGGSDAQQVYISLLQLLINPPENWLVGVVPKTPPQPDIEMALSLLEDNATKIPPELAFPLLPKDVPIHRIKHYLTASFSDHLNKKRNSQILRGLLYGEYLQVQELRIQLESQNLLITERDICPVCKKRFGHQSAFIRNPNGDVIHFSCQKHSQ